MKMEVDTYTATMVSGLAVIILAAVSVVDGTHDVSAILFLVGGLLVAAGFMPQRSVKDGPAVMGAAYGWYVSLVFICFFAFSINYAGRIFGAAEILGLTASVMVITMILSWAYLSWRE
ncbi:hypothetical protein [Methanothermobacter sp. K4]|uniref:hypothetical protein n=1 Tax=Methanothermobacter sp. K4 TaxID=2913262 RepID=UPI001EDAD1FA|nr:hypothetical protein [Methanothermobacter sp. K4]MCG2828235.1 hypothetical protein [Methanothermobacter sp. K4]